MKTKVINCILAVFIICLMTSCSRLPGHYLTKHDPGFYTKKNDAIVNATLEHTGYKSGIKLGGSIAITDHIFAGLNAGVHKNLLNSGQTIKGLTIRPEVGYYLNFGQDKNMYLELFAGGGIQNSNYSISAYPSVHTRTGNEKPLQFFGGAFMGCNMLGKRIGFDIAYEHNYYKDPALVKEVGFMDGPDGNPFSFIHISYNITTSFYVFKKFKNWDLYLNPGLNIGYTIAFVRMGATWRI